VAETQTVGFIETEDLKSKLQNRYILDLLGENDMMGLAKSCRGLKKFEIRGYKSFNKGRCKITRHGRNTGGFIAYVKNIIGQYVEEMVTEMEEMILI